MIRRDTARGYILFECVVSLVILGLGMMAINQGLRSAIHFRGLAQDFTRVAFLMDEFMGLMELQPKLMEETKQGTFPGEDSRFQYRWTVRHIEIPIPQPPSPPTQERPRLPERYMGQVSLTITWSRAGREFSRTLETLVPQSKLIIPEEAPLPPGVLQQ